MLTYVSDKHRKTLTRIAIPFITSAPHYAGRWYQCGTRNFRPRNGVSTMTKLTNKLIADLPIRTATYIVWDDETKGLGIRINDNRQFH